MTLRAVRRASSTTSNRAGPWKRPGCLDRRQHQGMQRGRRRYFFGQSPEADTRRQYSKPRPGSDDRERDRQSRPGRQKQRIGNCSRLRQRQRAERGKSKQCVRPEIVERECEGHRVIVAGLADPSNLAAEQQPGQEDRVAEPQDRAQKNRVDCLDRVIDQEARCSAEITPKRRPRQNVDGTGELRREPHHQDANEKRDACIGTDVLARCFGKCERNASPRPACRSRPAIR